MKRPSRRRFLLAALVLPPLLLAVWLWSLGGEVDEHVLARAGPPVVVERGPLEELRAGLVTQAVRLEAASGLAFDLRLLRPDPLPAEPVPLVVILGGHRTGRDAVELIGDPHGTLLAALDYPYTGPERPRGVRQGIAAARSLRPALRDTPAAVLTAIHFLLGEADVDPQRIELMGVSLGVPFAATAGALDPRVSRLWLVHGGGDNRRWLEHALESRLPRSFWRKRAAGLLNHLAMGDSLDAARRVQQLEGRPLVLVAAREDQRLPAESLQALKLAGSPSIQVLWTAGPHVDPRRPELVRSLVSEVLAHMGLAPSPP